MTAIRRQEVLLRGRSDWRQASAMQRHGRTEEAPDFLKSGWAAADRLNDKAEKEKAGKAEKATSSGKGGEAGSKKSRK
ncbi:hypothetical protein DIPPA_15861 [Diplonema papillatum]|nr:hypothetical protein DIPPA_15861 [Diplonema papillatum]